MTDTTEKKITLENMQYYRDRYFVVAEFKPIDEADVIYEKLNLDASAREKIKERRLFADIIRCGCIDMPVEACIIMINPGSCRKLSVDDSPKYKVCCDNLQTQYTVLENSDFYSKFNNITFALSDPAQKCVMALMEKCELHKVRMLNLSTLVCGNLKTARPFIEADDFSQRNLSKYLPQEVPVIIAWGVGTDFADKKKDALKKLHGRTIIGCQSKCDEERKDSIQPYEYYYIKPYKKEDQEKTIFALSEQYKQQISTASP